jgi:hypothetical protein
MLLYTYKCVYPWSTSGKLCLFLQTEVNTIDENYRCFTNRKREKLSHDMSILIIIFLRQQGLSTTHELKVPDSSWETNWQQWGKEYKKYLIQPSQLGNSFHECFHKITQKNQHSHNMSINAQPTVAAEVVGVQLFLSTITANPSSIIIKIMSLIKTHFF